MKNLISAFGAEDFSAKFVFQRVASGGKVSIDKGQTQTERTEVELKTLGEIKDELTKVQKEMETENQNKVRDQVHKDLEALKPTSLLDVHILVGKNDTMGAIAFGLDKMATKLWKDANPDATKVDHSAKEVNFNWKTEVIYYDKDGNAADPVPLSQANKLYPGDVITLSKDAEGKTVMHVNKEKSPKSGVEKSKETLKTAEEKVTKLEEEIKQLEEDIANSNRQHGKNRKRN
jgi:hypothetical protein